MTSLSAALARYLQRLRNHSVLSTVEERAVMELPGEASKVEARRDLIRPGDVVSHAILVSDGLLGRYDLMRNGARQITALHVPGDLCDLHSIVAPATGWGIGALNDATIVSIPHDAVRQLVVAFPNLALAFWRDGTVDASILAKWVGNIGRKNALARIAHMLCEMGLRMEAAGFGNHKNFSLDLTQEQIGDVVGLTSVHVNRTMRVLRERGVATVGHGRVDVKDWHALSEIAEFSPTYLLPYRSAHIEATVAAHH